MIPIRILLADDHSVVRAGLAALLECEQGFVVAAEAGNAGEAVEKYRQLRPDVVLMDLRMPGGGVQAIERIRSEFKSARIIVLTTYDSESEVRAALDAGAAGYLVKSVRREELLSAIRAVHEGRRSISREIATIYREGSAAPPLTERETEVLTLVAKGFNNPEIAEMLGFTRNTAKFHIQNIMTKLGAADRTEAATLAMQRGLILQPPS